MPLQMIATGDTFVHNGTAYVLGSSSVAGSVQVWTCDLMPIILPAKQFVSIIRSSTIYKAN